MDKPTRDYDALEDFHEALSAAIESGIDAGCHAVTDMYKAALARAEAAEAQAQAEFNRRIVGELESEQRIDELETELAALRARAGVGYYDEKKKKRVKKGADDNKDN